VMFSNGATTISSMPGMEAIFCSKMVIVISSLSRFLSTYKYPAHSYTAEYSRIQQQKHTEGYRDREKMF